jgi:hypothetical protein
MTTPLFHHALGHDHESDLATGTTAIEARRGAAGQFWTFTMSNSKAFPFAETMRFGAAGRMHVELTRVALSAARHQSPQAPERAPASGRRMRDRGENLKCCERFRTIRSLLPHLAEGCWPAAG